MYSHKFHCKQREHIYIFCSCAECFNKKANLEHFVVQHLRTRAQSLILPTSEKELSSRACSRVFVLYLCVFVCAYVRGEGTPCTTLIRLFSVTESVERRNLRPLSRRGLNGAFYLLCLVEMIC